MNVTLTITDRGVTVEYGSRIHAMSRFAASASNLHRHYGTGVHTADLTTVEQVAGRKFD